MDTIILVILCILLLFLNIRLYIYSIQLSNTNLSYDKHYTNYTLFTPVYIQVIVLSISSPSVDKYTLILGNHSSLSNHIKNNKIDTLAYNGHLFKIEKLRENILSLHLIGINKEYSKLNTGNIVHNAIMMGFNSFYVY